MCTTRIASFLVLLSSLCGFTSNAQNFRVESNQDSLLYYLKSEADQQYPDADATILYNLGKTELVYSGGISNSKYEIAFKVYNASEIGDLADVIIPHSSGGKISKIEATTYNLENGKIVETKLEKSNILIDEYTIGVDVVKFNIPGIKDGSVVRYTYTCEFGPLLYSWDFQKNYPVRFSRFDFYANKAYILTPKVNTDIPFKEYSSLKKYNQSKEPAASCEEMTEYQYQIARTWTRRNIAPFNKESFLYNEKIYKERVKIFYNGYAGNGYYYPIVENWEKFNKEVWYDKTFNMVFQKNQFLDQTLKSIIGDTRDSIEIAQKIFYHVQNEIKLNNRGVEIDQIAKLKAGNEMSINKYLTALYLRAGFTSDIILLSNKYFEKIDPILFNIDDLSNIVCRVVVKNVSYVASASSKSLPFGYLPLSYYNGYARIVNKEGGAINLTPALAIDNNNYSVSLKPLKKDAADYEMKVKVEYGVYSAIGIREEWNKDSLALINRIKGNSRDYNTIEGFKVNKIYVENSKDLSKKFSLIIEGELKWAQNVGNIMIEPYFFKTFSENPLKEKNKRKHPVEFDCVTVNKFKFFMQLPDHFEIDEVPEKKTLVFGSPTLLSFNNTVIANEKTNTIVINYQYESAATPIPETEAEDLRNFFNEMLKTYAQKIVVKRK
ncbi:MAG: hypothetical protein BGO31_00685 [Bacteroidetes bacterium 43-16]|nr:MAG: hypothetical protein BGO31_00685 [Bacteroidetes bacterium 43-16]